MTPRARGPDGHVGRQLGEVVGEATRAALVVGGEEERDVGAVLQVLGLGAHLLRRKVARDEKAAHAVLAGRLHGTGWDGRAFAFRPGLQHEKLAYFFAQRERVRQRIHPRLGARRLGAEAREHVVVVAGEKRVGIVHRSRRVGRRCGETGRHATAPGGAQQQCPDQRSAPTKRKKAPLGSNARSAGPAGRMASGTCERPSLRHVPER
ncbi:MAG: hypothetical protein BRD48_07480 [Bacteroidetes bacterium QS_9_68_14]|nr:MAG: hypothetical protein BRD48_07480 [Bacteroidetes bacterium QS_9_68_14]